MDVGRIAFGPVRAVGAPLDWDSVGKRYVKRNVTAETTFGPLHAGRFVVTDTRDHPGISTFGANDSYPTPEDNDWLQTFTGGQFWPLRPKVEDVKIEDIAHALAMQCRFGGHCLEFYSVAEHSDHIAWWLYERYGSAMALWGLLHDASEAYIVDVPRPIKPRLTGYKPIETGCMRVVCERFGLPLEQPPEVHDADRRIIADERANMAPCVAKWAGGYDNPLGITMQCWSPRRAEREFLMSFHALADEVARTAA